MTFLEPAAGITAFALAMPVLVVLYLLKLRRRPMRVSSILLWTAAARDLDVNTPFRWIRPSWMLLQQALGIALLCAALARPILSAGGDSPVLAVLVVDRSASMHAVDEPGGPTRLDRAKARASELVRTLTRDGAARGAVIAFGTEPTLVATPTQSRPTLDAAIESISPTDQPGDLDRALQLAASLTAGETGGDTGGESESQSSRGQPIVILLSDGGFGPSDRPRSIDAQVRFERIGPEGARDEGKAPPPPRNIGIVTCSARRDETDPSRVLVLVGLISNSARSEPVPVALAVDGQIAQTRTVTLQPAADEPSRGTVTFAINVPGESLLTATIPPGDALPSDDEASIILPAIRRPSVLLVQQNGPAAASATRSPDWLLGDALGELRLGTLRRVGPGQAQELLAGATEEFDVVVFDGVQAPKLPRTPSLHFGAPPAIEGLTITPLPAGSRRPTSILSWDRTNPTLREVTLDGLLCVPSTRVEVSEGRDATGPRLSVLARSDQGPVIIGVQDAASGRGIGSGGTRHLLVTFPVAESNWPLFPSFPIFLSAALDDLTSRAAREVPISFRTGEEASIAGTARAGGRVVLSGPEGRRIEISAAPEPEPGITRLGVLDRAGVYVVSGVSAAERATTRLVPVNVLDAQESSLASPLGVEITGSGTAEGGEGPIRRELWPWAVVAALILLTSEWFLYVFRARV
jgi:hypothetical protein